jgi:PhnB protein
MPVKPIPDGYHTVTPYIICDGAAAAIDYYKKAFGAEEIDRHGGHGGKIMHAEIKIGDSRLMLADEFPQMGAVSPKSLGGTPFGLCVYVKDCDALFNRAVAAGGKIERPLANQFYGDRSGTLIDPFGHKWTISTHVEDVSPAEMQKRMAAMMAKGGGDCGKSAG